MVEKDVQGIELRGTAEKWKVLAVPGNRSNFVLLEPRSLS